MDEYELMRNYLKNINLEERPRSGRNDYTYFLDGKFVGLRKPRNGSFSVLILSPILIDDPNNRLVRVKKKDRKAPTKFAYEYMVTSINDVPFLQGLILGLNGLILDRTHE